MQSNKKLKMNKLNFYIIGDKYIEYISGFDSHIAYQILRIKVMDIKDFCQNNIHILIYLKTRK